MTTFNYANPEKPTIDKAAAAVLDYSWDWTNWLNAGDSVASYLILPDSAINVVSDSRNAGVITAILSGGVLHRTHEVTCRITTTAGLVDERSIYLTIT
jgi:hypothetical protein